MPHVLRFGDCSAEDISRLFAPYQLELQVHADSGELPGSFWGDDEAGLIGNRLVVRSQTPLHSLLHEACHYICMDQARRGDLDTNAGGDYLEESAVCYLQILLGEQLPGINRARMFADMDAWGYSFRLGSTQKWFEQDAEDALQWLQAHGLLTDGQPNGRLRQ